MFLKCTLDPQGNRLYTQRNVIDNKVKRSCKLPGVTGLMPTERYILHSGSGEPNHNRKLLAL